MYTDPVNAVAGALLTSSDANVTQDNIRYLASRPKLLRTSNTAYSITTSVNVPLGMTGDITTEVEDARLLIFFSTQLTTTSDRLVTIRIRIDGTIYLVRQVSVSTSKYENVGLLYVSAELPKDTYTVDVQIYDNGNTTTIPVDSTTQLFAMEI